MRRASASASSRSRRASSSCSDHSSAMPRFIRAEARWSLLRAELVFRPRVERPHRCSRGGEVAALARQPEPRAGEPKVEEPPPRLRYRRGPSRSATAMCVAALLERGRRRGEPVANASASSASSSGARGREGGQQRAQRRLAAVEDEVDVVVGQQAGGVRPVAAPTARAGSPRPRVRAPRTTSPRRGAASRRSPGRSGGAPAAAGRRAGGGSGTSDRPASSDATNAFASSRSCRIASEPVRPGQGVGERAVDPLQHGGAQEQVAHVRRLALEHLRQQVSGDGALAAGELGDEPLGIGVAGQRDRRQPQAGRPPFGPLPELRRSLSRRARSRSPPATRASPRARSAGQGRGSRSARPPAAADAARAPGPRASPARSAAPAGSAARKRSSRPSASAERSSCRSSMTSTTGRSSARRSDSSRSTTASPSKAGVGADPLHQPVLAGRAGELHRRPRARSAAHPARRARSTPRRPDRPAPRTRPRTAAARSCRCRPARTGGRPRPGRGRQPVEQRAARHEPADGRQALRAGAAGHQCRLRGAPREGGAGRRACPDQGHVRTPDRAFCERPLVTLPGRANHVKRVRTAHPVGSYARPHDRPPTPSPPRASRRAARHELESGGPPRRPVLFVNPRSGGGRAMRAGVRRGSRFSSSVVQTPREGTVATSEQDGGAHG